MGCSQGGRIALDFAILHPDRVAALALVSTALSGAEEPEDYPDDIQPLVQAYEAADESDDLDWINKVEAHAWLDGPATPGGRVQGALRDLFLEMNGIALRHPELAHEEEPPSAMDQLHSIRQPVLLVSGELDFPHVVARHDMLEAELPNAFALKMEGVAHLPSLEKPQLFNTLLEEFLRQVFGN